MSETERPARRGDEVWRLFDRSREEQPALAEPIQASEEREEGARSEPVPAAR